MDTVLTFLEGISTKDMLFFSTKKSQILIVKSPIELLLDLFLYMEKIAMSRLKPASFLEAT